MATYEEWLKKLRESDKKKVEKWNANNPYQKITTDHLTTAPSKKEQEAERKRILEEDLRKKAESLRKKAQEANLKKAKAAKKEKEEKQKAKREKEKAERLERTKTLKTKKTTKAKRKNMTPEAKGLQTEAWNTNAYPRAVTGFYTGGINAYTGGINPLTNYSAEDLFEVTEDTKNSKAYKGGKIAGTVTAYSLGYTGAGALVKNGASKLLKTGASKKLVGKLAKTKVVKKAATNMLKKQGQNLTKKGVDHASRKVANQIGEGLARNLVGDMTVGTAMDLNVALADGLEPGTPEWNREMAQNALVNFGVGGAIEFAPAVVKAIIKPKTAKEAASAVAETTSAIKEALGTSTTKKSKLPDAKASKAALPERTIVQFPSKTGEAPVEPQRAAIVETPAKVTRVDDAAIERALTEKELDGYEKQHDEYMDYVAENYSWVDDGSPHNTPQVEIAEPLAGRNIKKVGSRTAKAFMNENPDVAPYFQREAKVMLGELSDFTKGERWYNTTPAGESAYDEAWGGTKRFTSSDIEELLDDFNYTYEDIRKGLEGIIAGGSKADNAVSKRIEFFLDQRLRNGYDEFASGYHVGPDEDYLKVVRGQQITDYHANVDRQRARADGEPAKQEAVNGFEVVGSTDETLGIISKDFRVVDDIYNKFKRKSEGLKSEFISGQRPLERMVEEGGDEVLLGATQAVRSSTGTVAHIFDRGLVDPMGKAITYVDADGATKKLPSYKKLMEQIPSNELDDFNTYAQHLHNIYRIAVDPERAVFRQTSAEESKAIVDKMLTNHPKFATYSKNITEWWNAFTKAWLLDTGRMTAEAYQTMLGKYPHYIPTYRTGKSTRVGNGTRGLSAGKAVGSAKGGTSEVEPLQNGFLKEMQRIIRSTRENELYKRLVDELRAKPEDLKQYGVVTGEKPNTSAADDVTAFLDDIDQEGLKSVHDRVAMVTAYIDGQPVSAYVNKDVYNALQLLRTGNIDYERHGFFVKAGTAITNPVKSFITTLNPLFNLANVMRDLPTLLIQSKHGVLKNLTGLARVILWHMPTNSEVYQTYKGMGVKHSGYFAQNKGFTDAKGIAKNPATKLLRAGEKGLSALGETFETIPRMVEFLNSLEKYAGDPDAPLRALNDASEVTVNFSRSAPTTKLLDAWTLYLNAAVQGLDKFARTVKANPVKTTARTASVIGVPYLYLLMMNANNPHYQDLNERTKQNYFCVPNICGEYDEDGNAMTFIKIPLNREYGALFGALLDVAWDYWRGDEDPWQGVKETAKTNFLPPSPLSGGVLGPIVHDLPNNKDFAGRSIVPANLENASPINQQDATTSGAALGVATFANNLSERIPGTDKVIPETLRSPKKVDFLIDSYGGYLGSVLQSATAQGANSSEDFLKENLWQGTVIDPFLDRFTADPRYSSGVLEDFYNDMRKVEQGKTDEGLEEEKGVNYAKYKVYTEISEELTELSKQEKEILSSNMTKAQKEAAIKKLREQKNELARSAKDRVAEAETEYESDPSFAILSNDVKDKWSSDSNVSKTEFANAYNSRTIKDGKKKGLANAMEMYNAGSSYDAARLVDAKLSEETWTKAGNLSYLGFTPQDVQTIANGMDADGNKSYSKDEITAYLDNSHYSEIEKAYLFDAFASWKNARNPYY